MNVQTYGSRRTIFRSTFFDRAAFAVQPLHVLQHLTRPGLEVKDAKQLIAMAKANPGKLSYASSGTGTPPQLAGEFFKQSTGTFITHVPYRGAAPALQQRFGDLGAEPVALETADFKKLFEQEGKTLSALIRDRKIIVE
jgi:tripartite-type tricarboxylate transporter receptor subunit TctC